MGITRDDLRRAADDAAQQSAKGLAVFQLTAAYVAVFLLQLSDADYLVGLGQSMPIIGGTVPTKLFLAIAPSLLFVLHVAALLQWTTLRGRVRNLLDELDAAPPVERAKATELLFPFTLTGSLISETRSHRARWSAIALTLVALVAVPLLMLIWIQVRSLAFHDSNLTLLQRCIVLMDLTALWIYLPLGRKRPQLREIAVPLVASALIVFYVTWDAVVPGDSVTTLPQEGNWTDQVRLRRLDLQGATLQTRAATVAEDKAAKTPLLDLQGKDLRFADLSSATFVRTALNGSNFTGAHLQGTRFLDATFSPLPVESHGKENTGKRKTTFAFTTAANADFTGQDLSDVDFTGTIGPRAKFPGANLTGATLTGASFDFADFRAADLRRANLRITSLIGADLRHALLSQADLTGADLRGSLWFRNPMFLTRMHLVDMTYSRLGSLDKASTSQVRTALATANPNPFESEKAWRGLEEQSTIGIDTPRGRGFYGLLRRLGWGLRYDYLPIPSGVIDSVPRESYLVMLKALIANEVRENPKLQWAIASRLALEPLYIRMIYTKDTLPHISKPNVMDIKQMQRLWLEPQTVIDIVTRKSQDLDDKRYSPWHVETSAADRLVNPPPWMEQFLNALAIQKDEETASKLIHALWEGAKAGDDLAFSLLPHVIPHPLTATYQPTVDWLVAEVVPRKADPKTRIAIASLLQAKSPQWHAVLDTTKTTSPDIDWVVGSATGGIDLVERAAAGRHVVAGGSFGTKQYLESKLKPEALEDAWNQMGRAAYRGVPSAQWAVGFALAQQGDFGNAVRWYAEAANEGRVNYVNSLAWVLATCPDSNLRDPGKSLSLAMLAWREIKATSKKPELGNGADLHSMVLDTLAAAYAATGDFAHAVAVQSDAIAALGRKADADQREGFQRRLAAYKAKRPWIDNTGHYP